MSETVKVGKIVYMKRDGRWEWGARYKVEDMYHASTLDALAAAQAELEEVRRVEAWLMQQPLTHYIARNYDDSLAALGRLLKEGEWADTTPAPTR